MSQACDEGLLNEAIEALRNALYSYLYANCRRTLSMIKLTGQKRLRLEFHGLFRHYSPTENFPRFMDAYSYILQCRDRELITDVLECEEINEQELYIVFNSRKYEELCKELLTKSPETEIR